MLAAERKMQIIDFVKQHRSATVAALAKKFKVHEATIRRDLVEIEQEGLLKRTHGGVVVADGVKMESSFSERAQVHLDQKRRIGQAAAAYVEDGDHIIIDSGTTTLHIAQALKEKQNLTVVTNDINVASELKDAEGIRVLVSGGELYPSSYMLNGMYTNTMFEHLHVHKAFIGTPAVHHKYGLTHPEAQLVPTKQGMIQAAQEVIVVADHTKIGKVSLHTVAPVHAIHMLITGSELSKEETERFIENGMNVITV